MPPTVEMRVRRTISDDNDYRRLITDVDECQFAQAPLAGVRALQPSRDGGDSSGKSRAINPPQQRKQFGLGI